MWESDKGLKIFSPFTAASCCFTFNSQMRIKPYYIALFSHNLIHSHVCITLVIRINVFLLLYEISVEDVSALNE